MQIKYYLYQLDESRQIIWITGQQASHDPKMAWTYNAMVERQTPFKPVFALQNLPEREKEDTLIKGVHHSNSATHNTY